MLVWALVYLLSQGPEPRPTAYWLTAKECEATQNRKRNPEAFYCKPIELPIDRK